MALITLCGKDSHNVWQAYKDAQDAHSDREEFETGVIDTFGRILG